MAKKAQETKNIRIHGDSHEIISKYAKTTHQTIAGLVHQFALAIKSGRFLP